MSRLIACTALLLCVSACDGDDSALLVDLRSDYVPGLDFVTVEVSAIPAGATTELPSSLTVTTSDSFLPDGSRVAEYRSIPTGTTSVRVRLRSRAGGFVGEGRVVVDVQGTVGVTVVISRSCESIECPIDDPAATTCYGGRCVTPDCRPGDMASCGEPECSTDGDCDAAAPCGVGQCVGGVCFTARDDSACGAMEICDPSVGCVPAPVEDAGLPDTSAGDTGIADTAVAPLSRAEFMAEAQRLTCAAAIRCHGREGVSAFFLDMACHTRYTTVLTESFMPWLAAGPGTGYDESAARACLAELPRHTDCRVPFPEACFEALPGTLPNGSGCSTPSECMSGNCDEPSIECSGGTCVATGGDGEPCGVAPCARGHYCHSTDTCRRVARDGEDCSDRSCGSGLTCDADRCRPGPALGEACSVPPFGADPCVDGNRCSGTCVAPAAPGAVCSGGVRCPDGTRCAGGVCRLTVGPGGRCGLDSDCPIFFHCESDVCTEDPVAGSPCGGSAGNCIEGICDGGTCRLGRAGQPCSDFEAFLRQCEGACSDSVCRDPITAGSACGTMAWSCGTESYCSDTDRCTTCP